MSGIEVVGAVAAAIQLADAGLAILIAVSRICRTIRDHPQTLQNRQRSVEQLIDITHDIRSNPALDTMSIRKVLKTSVDDARELLEILEPLTPQQDDELFVRYWKTLRGTRRESGVLRLLERLEEDRAALTLCIVAANSSTLGTVDRNVEDLAAEAHVAFQHIPNVEQAVEQATSDETLRISRAMEVASLEASRRLNAILDMQTRTLLSMNTQRFRPEPTSDDIPATDDGMQATDDLQRLPEQRPSFFSHPDVGHIREDDTEAELVWNKMDRQFPIVMRLRAANECRGALCAVGGIDESQDSSGITAVLKELMRVWILMDMNDFEDAHHSCRCTPSAIFPPTMGKHHFLMSLFDQAWSMCAVHIRRYEEARDHAERSLVPRLFTRLEKAQTGQIALTFADYEFAETYSRCLRSLGRFEESLDFLNECLETSDSVHTPSRKSLGRLSVTLTELEREYWNTKCQRTDANCRAALPNACHSLVLKAEHAFIEVAEAYPPNNLAGAIFLRGLREIIGEYRKRLR